MLWMIFPASVAYLLFPIFIFAFCGFLIMRIGAAKSSFIYGIMSMVFLTLTVLTDIASRYYLTVPDIMAIMLTLLTAFAAFIASIIALVRISLKINLQGRKQAVTGSLLGMLTYIFVTVWITWVIFSNFYPI